MPNAKKPDHDMEAMPISNPRRMQGERSRQTIPNSQPEETHGEEVGECSPALNQP